MLDAKFIAENRAAVEEAVRNKGDKKADVARICALYEDRKARQAKLDEMRRKLNEASQRVAQAKRKGESADALIAENRAIGDAISREEQDYRRVEGELNQALAWVPNVPAADVPVGDPRANRVVRTHGEPAKLSFPAKPHWEIGAKLGILDEERGAKLAGSNFALFRGLGARLSRALLNFMLDIHTREHGYTEFWPPAIARRDSMFGSAQLPKMEDDMYRLERDDLFLIPTAEVALVNIHRGEVLAHTDLPRCYTAYTPCFRREAGAYGSDTRGLIRIHQFDKVELVKITTPETSVAEHEKMLADAEDILRRLGLTYRVVMLATGDMSFASVKTYDLEVWAPGVGRWLEASSVSNCGDFQARRADIRYRDAQKKMRHVHMLNGSGVALPRTIIGILETHQQPDGTVVVPEPLRTYVGADRLAP